MHLRFEKLDSMHTNQDIAEAIDLIYKTYFYTPPEFKEALFDLIVPS